MRAQIFTLAISAIAALSVLSGRPAAAADFFVSPANLPSAITSASDGDTIYVSAGTCSAHVTVNKVLNIRGAQAGVAGSANTRGASETILSNGVTVTASGVQLNGLVIRGGDLVGDVTGTGVMVKPYVFALLFSNNIVEDNTFGMYLNGSGHIVQYNLFRNNNRPGSARGDGIYSDFGLQDAIITNNSFNGNSIGSVVLMGGINGGVLNNVTVSNNTILNDGTLALYGGSYLTVSGNLICNVANGHCLMIGGGNNHVTVSDNQFLASQYRGVRVSAGGKYSANKDVRIYNNDIANNRQGGLSVVDGAYNDGGTLVYDQNVDGKVDAECNSWGAITGPTNASNPSGTGDKVSGDADFVPFRKYIPLTAHVSATLLQTYSNVSTRTYLQVIRITNNGGKAVVGPAYYVLDGLTANGVQLVNSTGTQDDACQPPVGSPWYTFVANGSTLLPGQSVIVTLKFTTNVGVTFSTSKIGGTDGTIANPVGRRILAANYR
jgi:hypothetical protein